MAHRKAIRAAFAYGYEVDYAGDSFFYAFASASTAAAAVRAVLAAHADGPIRARFGIHTGEPTLDSPKYVGMDVHRAARIMAAAHGGQAVLSQATRELLEHQEGLRDLGEHRLKDLSVPIRLYQLGDGEFPPLRSLHRTNLPIPPTPFVGRERELAEITSLLQRDDVRLLTLSGPGGSGKTRLALQAAADAADAFPAGVWWVPLATVRDPHLLPPAIVRALGLGEQRGADAAAQLETYLTGRRLLLLLDNLEQLIDGIVFLGRLVEACPGLSILATSRQPLRLGAEHVYPIPPLARADALALFDQRARALRPDFSANGEVAEICRRLDDLPLAIELAAARIAALSPRQLLERLDRTLPLLTGGSRDAPDRQRTLRATIAWSHDLLDPHERRLFARLAVFRGGCTLEAAEQVCDADLDTLQSLVDKSLIRLSDGRYSMLETIREFALEQLEKSGEDDELADRHLRFFAALSAQAEPELRRSLGEPWLGRVADELDNFRSALERASAASRPQPLALIVCGLAWLWFARGGLHEASGWLEQTLAQAERLDLPMRARLFAAAAFISIHRGDHLRASTLAEEGRRIFQELGDAEGVIESANVLCFAAATREDFATARSIWEQSRAFARRKGLRRLQAVSAMNLGDVALHSALVDEGRALSQEAFQLFREIGSVLAAQALLNLGYAAMLDGNRNNASRSFGDSLAESLRTRSELNATWALAGLSWTLADVRPSVAACSLGAAEAAMDLTGGAWHWMGDAMRQGARTTLRDRLDEKRLEALMTEGRAMPFEEAARQALEAASAFA